MTETDACNYWGRVIDRVTTPKPKLDSLLIEPEAEYHAKAGEYLSSHLLADFVRCPYGYHRTVAAGIKRQDTPAFLVGRAAHKLILEGHEAFEASYAFGGPVNEKTGKPYGQGTKAWSDWEAEQGKAGLTDDQYALIAEMSAGVQRNMKAAMLVDDGMAERVVRTEYRGCPSQSRFDWINPAEGIVDLKTCDDLTWFEADAKRFRYLYQMAFYRAMLAAATGWLAPVHIIAVEKKEPFRCGVWTLDTGCLDIAQAENEAAIVRLLECRDRGEWPTGYEEVRTLTA